MFQKNGFWKILAVMAVAVLLLCAVPRAQAAEDEEVVYYVRIVPQFNSQTSVTELEGVNMDALRTRIIEGLYAHQAEINIRDFNIPNDAGSVDAIVDFVFNEISESFCAENWVSYGSSGGYLSGLRFQYRYTAEEYKSMMRQIEEVRDRFIGDLQGRTEVEKALLLHDRLAAVCEYDLTYAKPNRYDMYGALIDGTAVCQGYAEAYSYLLRAAGIESYMCSSSDINHAWNIVYVDNVPYHVDVTWDDPIRDITGRVCHTNFLRSTEGIMTNHRPKDEAGNYIADYTPDYDTFPTDTRYDSYYWQNSDAEFQLVNGTIYYIDKNAAAIKTTGGAQILTLESRWPYPKANYYWPGCYSKLSSVGNCLLYSTTKDIRMYDIATGTTTQVFAPDLSIGTAFSVYGFTYQKGYLICDLNDSPSFTATTKAQYGVRELLMFSDPNMKFKQATLTLKSSLAINFYVRDSVLDSCDEPYVIFKKAIYGSDGTVTGYEEQKVTAYELRNTADNIPCHVFTFKNVSAKEMGSEVEATVYATRNGLPYRGKTVTYSAEKYATSMLGKTEDATLKTLLVDMLNYGAAAQTYFGYNTANLANRDLTVAQKAFATAATPTMASCEKRTATPGATVDITACSLLLRDKVCLNFYLDVAGYAGAAGDLEARFSYKDANGNQVTLTVDGSKFVPVTDGNEDALAVTLDTLGAVLMRQACNVTVYEKSTGNAVSDTVRYSIESYAAPKAGGTDTLSRLTNAMMKYGDSAVRYQTGDTGNSSVDSPIDGNPEGEYGGK